MSIQGHLREREREKYLLEDDHLLSDLIISRELIFFSEGPLKHTEKTISRGHRRRHKSLFPVVVVVVEQQQRRPKSLFPFATK